MKNFHVVAKKSNSIELIKTTCVRVENFNSYVSRRYTKNSEILIHDRPNFHRERHRKKQRRKEKEIFTFILKSFAFASKFSSKRFLQSVFCTHRCTINLIENDKHNMNGIENERECEEFY
jgi:hypothetical protein